MPRTLRALVILCACASVSYAQQFKLFDRNVQIHGFASQGFAYSGTNNFLTMNTSKGSFALTDFGFNASASVTDKFRVGAQLYDRNVGRLGNWRPDLDWAFADYRFTKWFGARGGKVKTVLGLYNDTQDMEFLHTWAIMPSSVYPVDVRGDNIAHIGGDLYGNISTKKAGTWSYTVYGGQRPNDAQGGYLFGLSTSSRVSDGHGGFRYITSQTKKITNYGGPIYGADLRWTTPLKGLIAGISYVKQDITTTGSYVLPRVTPYKMVTLNNNILAYYTEYTWRNLKLAGEYRREIKKSAFNAPTGAIVPGDENARNGYVAASYRFTKWLELGTYQSRYIANWASLHSDPNNHIYDSVFTARFDLNRYVDCKVEGHLIDGAMINSVLDRGFYAAANPGGLQPTMKMLVMRVGYHF